MNSYQDIIEYAKENKSSIIENKKIQTALNFISIINNEGVDEQKELKDLKVFEKAISIAGEVFDEILEKMEKGVI